MREYLPSLLMRARRAGTSDGTFLIIASSAWLKLDCCSSKFLPRDFKAAGIAQGTLNDFAGEHVRCWFIYHIFKNAGTSFEWTLEPGSRNAVFAPYDSTAPKPDSFRLPISLDGVKRRPETEAVLQPSGQFSQAAENSRSRDCDQYSYFAIRSLGFVRFYAFERQQKVSYGPAP